MTKLARIYHKTILIYFTNMKDQIYYSIKMISLILLVQTYQSLLTTPKIHAISGLTTSKGFQIAGGIKQAKFSIIFSQI